MSTVVVTGVAGYIGGEIALLLKDAGHTVVGIDYRPLQKHQKGLLDSFVLADFDSDTAYKKLLDVRPTAIVHCAGTSLVGPTIATMWSRPWSCSTLLYRPYLKLDLSLAAVQQCTVNLS